jgi:hypothetical protein
VDQTEHHARHRAEPHIVVVAVDRFPSATMNFFENNGNEKGISELLIREGDSIAVPFPEPPPLLEDPGKTQ